MNDNLLRLNSTKMVNYHFLYRNSVRWNGDRSLKGKKVILYGEQGCGDVLQFIRYIPYLIKQQCELYVHAHSALRSLIEYNFKIAGWFDKESDDELPPHDYHILSLSLPFLVNFIPTAPYLTAPDEPIPGFEGKTKIGIAWEGNPSHSNNFERSCPLKWFQKIEREDRAFFMIQQKPNLNWFINDAEHFPLLSTEQENFLDTAKLIKQMDYIVTVDTAALHLASAMGLKTYGLLSHYHDPRWNVGNWYPSLTLLKQNRCDDWSELFDQLIAKLDNKPYTCICPEKEKILITGGIGDFLTLCYYMSKEERESISCIYLATRAYREIGRLCAGFFPRATVEVIWEEFHNLDAFDRKGHVTEAFAHYYMKTGRNLLPTDWYEVDDYSIEIQFQKIRESKIELDFRKTELKKYVLICPTSNNQYIPGRNFDKKDWENTISWLKKWGTLGIVIGTRDDAKIPEHPLIFNMKGTNIEHSVKLAEECNAYIGIDSWPSVVATKHLKEKILIKSISNHLKEFADIYYAPHKKHGFIVEKIPAYDG